MCVPAEAMVTPAARARRNVSEGPGASWRCFLPASILRARASCRPSHSERDRGVE
jgi:hypothetical protein